MKSIKALFKLTVFSLVTCTGLFLFSCSTEDQLNENLEVTNEKMTKEELDESFIKDVETVLFSKKNRTVNMTSQDNCNSVSSYFHRSNLYSYPLSHINYPINSLYRYPYYNRTYLLKKIRNTGIFKNDFITVGVCSNYTPTNTFNNTELSGIWRVVKGNSFSSDPNVILYINRNGVVGVRGCNFYGNVKTTKFISHPSGNQLIGDISFYTRNFQCNTIHSSPTQNQSNTDNFINELSQVRKWILKSVYGRQSLELKTNSSFYTGRTGIYLEKISNL